ncbi:glycosyltransferase [Nitrosomonas oligotropha]|uniref:Glycosyltransferase involved in cell wall bisynthesis n=1 Tax=Nitrosomonas oligotropha TaxID=42354 RepID=A0A1H8PJI2_9PROT|nr:glycosyltransferase [Nitrosomonas oligotropha]SDW79517.1 Glycosyltransferase involved in cell wall bisynthesis [Nitrosomonas oligotropha]SEO42085.1 Glycosyltransferase involved in cell wall bisynthesis [Nitrosomonas oligotropha]
MKIVHIVEALSIKGGGGDLSVAELAEQQAKIGHNVSIVYFKDLRKGDQELNVRGVRKIGIPPSQIPIMRNLGFLYGLTEYFERELNSVDIVHIHGLWRWLLVAAASFCYKNNIPYISQPHGSLSRIQLKFKWIQKKIWWSLFDRKLVLRASKVQAESGLDFVELTAAGIPRNKIYTAPCGIDFGAIAEAKNIMPNWGVSLKDNGFILFLARLDVNKGLDLLIKALAQIPEEIQLPKIVICGPDYHGTADKMKMLAREYQIDNKLVWTGIITKEKWWAYRNAALYILPSKSENFGITVLEAMANRCPVLTTTATAWQEAGELNCAIVVPPTVAGIKKGLLDFFRIREDERLSMTTRAYEYVISRFDHAIVTQRILKEYEEILAFSHS